MKNLVLYIHGKGGSAAECGHYRPLFPGHEVIGLDYQTFTPWETGKEIRQAVERLKNKYKDTTLTVLEDGEHWFHTAQQMRFLDDWIRPCKVKPTPGLFNAQTRRRNNG